MGGRRVTGTFELYRVNSQLILFSTTYRRSRELLTPLSACKFVQHRVGHRVGNVATSMSTVNPFRLAQSANRHGFHFPLRACHPCLATGGRLR